jgi:hypothetical protein
MIVIPEQRKIQMGWLSLLCTDLKLDFFTFTYESRLMVTDYAFLVYGDSNGEGFDSSTVDCVRCPTGEGRVSCARTTTTTMMRLSEC